MRIEQLTFTRFIAAILIVIFHYGRETFFFTNSHISFIFKQANVGVSYFFVLSGFVMIIAYKNKKAIPFLKFLKNRLARIYPVYLMAIILVLIFKVYNAFSIVDLPLNLFMIQAWFHDKALSINTPGWSLSVEFFFYLLFPFLMNRYYTKIHLKTLAFWIISFWIISQIVYHLLVFKSIEIPFFVKKDISYHPVMHLNAFLVGNLAGLFFIKNRDKLKSNYRLVIILLLFILVLLLKFSFGLNYHNGLLSLIFAPLIILMSLNNDKITQILSHRLFVFLGEISYGIYILQFPIWALLNNYRMRTYFKVNPEEDYLLTFTIRLFILIIIAGFSYVLFEKPLRAKIKNLRFIN
ncbi:acyltransferase family protein [Algibacter sp. PT7-4]|uniref:acyltransferase family protein n=1 Tax=Algibacter ulvanivorans TaxID=3400999 RepID=UPI003AACC20A